MLTRFYMSPPANPSGSAYQSVSKSKYRSDSNFSVAPFQKAVNSTAVIRRIIPNTSKNRRATSRPDVTHRDQKTLIFRGYDVYAAVLLPAGLVVLLANRFVFAIADNCELGLGDADLD
jgi:hypothetical protein